MTDVRADYVFAARTSELMPYEPVFGYGYPGLAFKSHLHVGPIAPAHPGEPANFNDPLALFAPELAGREPFSLLPDAQAADLRLLLRRRQPAWPRPFVQTVADITSVLGLAGIAAALFLGWRAGRPVRQSASPVP
jgi:hypothetical protein